MQVIRSCHVHARKGLNYECLCFTWNPPFETSFSLFTYLLCSFTDWPKILEFLFWVALLIVFQSNIQSERWAWMWIETIPRLSVISLLPGIERWQTSNCWVVIRTIHLRLNDSRSIWLWWTIQRRSQFIQSISINFLPFEDVLRRLWAVEDKLTWIWIPFEGILYTQISRIYYISNNWNHDNWIRAHLCNRLSPLHQHHRWKKKQSL